MQRNQNHHKAGPAHAGGVKIAPHTAAWPEVAPPLERAEEQTNARHRKRSPVQRGWRLFALIMVLGFLSGDQANAEWAVLNHSNAIITSGQAICLAAPTQPGKRLRLKRIRLTRTGTSDVSHTFAYAVTTDSPEDTEAITVCTPPTCNTLVTLEGTKQGRPYDFDGLDLLLPPDARLYLYEDTHAAGEYVTVEVFYEES